MGLCMSGYCQFVAMFLLEVEGDDRRVLFREARYCILEAVEDIVLVH